MTAMIRVIDLGSRKLVAQFANLASDVVTRAQYLSFKLVSLLFQHLQFCRESKLNCVTMSRVD